MKASEALEEIFNVNSPDLELEDVWRALLLAGYVNKNISLASSEELRQAEELRRHLVQNIDQFDQRATAQTLLETNDKHFCHCCRTTFDWQSAKFVGVQPVEDEPDLELRNCPKCSSTCAKVSA